MAYDAAFLTGSDTRPVDPISSDFYDNELETAKLNSDALIITQDERTLGHALESFDQMADIALIMESNVRQGRSLSSSLYRILNIEMKSAARLTKAALDPLPAFESLDHMSPRELSIAMEGVVGEFLKDVWEKIKQAYLKVHNGIKAWFIKAFDGAGRLKKQAEALKSKAEGMMNSEIKNKSFESSGVKHLNVKGKPANPQQIVQGVGEITTITDKLLGKTAESYNNMFRDIEGALNSTIITAKNMKDSNGDKDTSEPNYSTEKTEFSPVGVGAAKASPKSDSTTNKLLVQIVNDFFKAAKEVGIVTNSSAEIKGDPRWNPEKQYAWRYPKDLLGDIMLVCQSATQGAPTTIESYSQLKKAFKISPEPIQEKPRELEDNGTWITADTNSIISIAESTVQCCDTIHKYRQLFDVREKNTGELVKKMNQLVSSNANLKGAGQRHIKESISTTLSIVQNLQNGETRWAKYAFSVLNKSIVYCRNSLKQY